MSSAVLRLASVLLVNQDGALLLQLREATARMDPDRWGLPGGHVEPGEDPAVAAAREARLQPGTTIEWHVYCGAAAARQADVVLGEGAALRFTSPREAAGLRFA